MPKVDYRKLAGLAGLTNPVSASNAWAKIKKKLAAQASDYGTANGNDGATPKPTPSKKRAKKASIEDGEDESPTKKAKKTPVRKGVKVKKEVVEDEEGSEMGSGTPSGGAVVRDGAGEGDSGDGLEDVPFFD